MAVAAILPLSRVRRHRSGASDARPLTPYEETSDDDLDALASVPVLQPHARQHAGLAGQGRGPRPGAQVRPQRLPGPAPGAGHAAVRAADPDRQRHRQGLRGAAGRRRESPKFEDNEATLDELRERIRKTIDYVQSSVPAAGDRRQRGARRSRCRCAAAMPLQFNGETYLKHYALPNFYLPRHHCLCAAAPRGVELGKADFLGR